MSKSLPNTTSTTPVQDQIAKEFGKLASSVSGFAIAQSELRDEGQRLAAEHGNKRAGMLAGFAGLACKGGWSDEHIVAAIDGYIDLQNDKKNSTLLQFARECKTACHMNARAFVAQDMERAAKLWAAERKSVADAKAKHVADGVKTKFVPPETPISSAFPKEYHLVFGSNGMLAARVKGSPELAETPVLLARHNVAAKAGDPKEAAKRIKGLIDTVEQIAAEFPHQQWPLVTGFLKTLSPDVLTQNRNAALFARQMAAHASPSMPAAAMATQPMPTKRERRAARKGNAAPPANVDAAIDATLGEIA